MSVFVDQIVTYAGDTFRGNPAFVVTFEQPRAASVLSNLCAQLHEGVLAVLIPDGAEIDLRFATPTGSHPGAGHSTHAAARVAFSRLRPGAREIAFRLEKGDRRMARVEDDLIAVDWPVMSFSDVDQVDALAPSLGRRPERTFEAPFGTVAVYPSPQDVHLLAPDLDAVARLKTNTVIVTAPGDRSDLVIRVFAPKLGLPEDPVCGTAHRIIVPMWAKRLGKTSLVSHQLSERTGELFCEWRNDIVTIAGRAVPFLEGTLQIPE
jgi:predicted PhzF superfamily epimerase YddE/YHI9